eukprot:GSMAST32.ASY1.ANO1.429.1 assembled CDS
MNVILLLIFVVASIHFLNNILLYVFTNILIGVADKRLLSLVFLIATAVLSAFLDALTVVAVVSSVCTGFLGVYYHVCKTHLTNKSSEVSNSIFSHQEIQNNIEDFKSFLRSLIAVGTVCGGITTTVAEPQNLIISDRLNWGMIDFFLKLLPVFFIVFPTTCLMCVFLEHKKCLGYGVKMPPKVRIVLQEFADQELNKLDDVLKAELFIQCIGVVILCVGLVLHVLGFIGLLVLVFVTSLNGITDERDIAHAFMDSMPFVSLIVIFFGVVAIIHVQLFNPIISCVLSMNDKYQPAVLYTINGVLSTVSDNVFVATVFIDEIVKTYKDGTINDEQFERLGIALTAGTNLPSMATPNGQAAFLFVLTSSIAPLVNLTYRKMCIMALPYTVVVTFAGLFSVLFLI